MSGIALFNCPYHSYTGHVVLATITGNDALLYDFNGTGVIRNSPPLSDIRPPEEGLYWRVPEAKIKKLRRIAQKLRDVNTTETLHTPEDKRIDCVSAITRFLQMSDIDCYGFPMSDFKHEQQLEGRVQSLSGQHFDRWVHINENLKVFNRSNIFMPFENVIAMLQEELKQDQKITCKPPKFVI